MKKLLFMFMLLFVGALFVVAQEAGEEVTKDLSWIWQAISAISVVLVAFFKKQVDKFKGKTRDVIVLGVETMEAGEAGLDLANYCLEASQDHVFSDEEKKAIKEKAVKFKDERADVKAQWKVLWTKNGEANV